MTILSHQNTKELISAAVDDFAELANKLLGQKQEIAVLLTGGTLGIEFIAKMQEKALDWSRIWLMFSDERFVPLDDPDRNEYQALEAWPQLSPHLTRFPAADSDLVAARDSLDQKLVAKFGPISQRSAVFDLTVLGMGPDAHVASLFPDSDQPGDWVIAESSSPKPPPERLSLSYQALNRSDRIWFLAAGSAKTTAVSQSLDQHSGLPAAKVRGLQETRWYLDREITDEL